LLQLIVIIFAVSSLIFFWVFVPESPKWLYAFGRYDEARAILRYVGSANSKPEEKLQRFDKLKFDIEVLDEMDMGGSVTAKTTKSQRLNLISDKQYCFNLIVMTIMWTAASFSFYML